nr:TetR/AcrR family transcriptional regulator [Kibdelosporangium sp. MJ126-NF4]CEL13773.1 Transcriptional regulator, TetR family [Kibdelosporangium sp. MJ126-NF4]CTQ88141.1 Transcriptional regulator, TetR family [Kibdelosporangium sp. MJ126-NF4]
MPDQHQRADARRNYTRILAVAEQEVATHGANASLEQIARTAGVGSATVRRHFPTRHALLEAVSHTRIDALSTRAHTLTTHPDSRTALIHWLDDVATYCVTARGLATALAYTGDIHNNNCSATLEHAAQPLLHRAIQDNQITPDVTVTDLITLVVGIALATEHYPDPTTQAHRLLHLAITGLSPNTGERTPPNQRP